MVLSCTTSNLTIKIIIGGHMFDEILEMCPDDWDMQDLEDAIEEAI